MVVGRDEAPGDEDDGEAEEGEADEADDDPGEDEEGEDELVLPLQGAPQEEQGQGEVEQLPAPAEELQADRVLVMAVVAAAKNN